MASTVRNSAVAERVVDHLEPKLGIHNIDLIEALLRVGSLEVPDSIQIVLISPDDASLSYSMCSFADLADELKSRYR